MVCEAGEKKSATRGNTQQNTSIKIFRKSIKISNSCRPICKKKKIYLIVSDIIHTFWIDLTLMFSFVYISLIFWWVSIYVKVIISYVVMLFFFITAQGNGSDWWSFCTVNGWYSMFGLFEWLFLWSAMMFHMIEHVDMYYMNVAWVVSRSAVVP